MIKTENPHLDNLVQFLLENIANILGKDLQYAHSIFTPYEVMETPMDNNEIELSINTTSGLINIIVKDATLYECLIFPNSLCVGTMLTDNCNNIFLKVSDTYWLNKEATVRVRRQKVFGLCYYLTFEYIKLKE